MAGERLLVEGFQDLDGHATAGSGGAAKGRDVDDRMLGEQGQELVAALVEGFGRHDVRAQDGHHPFVAQQAHQQIHFELRQPQRRLEIPLRGRAHLRRQHAPDQLVLAA